MRIAERLARPEPCFSFEFFPPRTDEGVASLMRTIAELADLQPGFVSVTYGALGSARLRTLEVATHIKAHRSAAGAKGGTTPRRSAARAAAAPPKSTP